MDRDRLATLAIRVFAALLFAYPPAFRARFGRDMTRAFSDSVEDAIRISRFAVMRVALRALAGAIVHGLAERRYVIGAVLKQDVRFAFRLMRRQPVLTAISVLTLAIGIGASTAIFSLVDAVLLRPLPFPQPDKLVSVAETFQGGAGSVSFENLLDWKQRSRSLSALTPIQAASVNFTGIAEPDRLRGGFVTSDFFLIAGASPHLGRTFVPDDDRPGAAPVGVLNYATWEHRFGGDSNVVGRTLTLNNVPVEVVGVLPAGFDFPFDEVEIWLPVRLYTGGLRREDHSLFAVARLQPEVTVAQAQAELDRIARDLESVYPPSNAGRGIRIEPLHSWLTSVVDRQLVIVFGLVLALLVISTANVTSLHLGGSLGRRSEIAVRTALGASSRRIVVQFLVQHALIAFVGGAIGLAVASTLLPLAARAAPIQIFGLDRVGIDTRVLIFVAAISMGAGILSGLTPALYWSRRTQGDVMQAAGRVTGERRLTIIRRVVVTTEVALATVLLVAGGLVIRSYWVLLNVPIGFNPANVLSLEYRLPRNKYPGPHEQAAFHDAVVEQVRAIPGVRHAAIMRALPFSGNSSTINYLTDQDDPASSGKPALLNTVSDDFFLTLGISILEGRSFGPQDHSRSPMVAVVSRALAETEWPGGSAISKELRVAGTDRRAGIIGVAGNIRHISLADQSAFAIYVLNRQNPAIFMTLAARTSVDPLSLSDSLRRAVWKVDPDQPVWKVRTLESLVGQSLGLSRFVISVLVVFSVAALVLVVTGLAGVIGQSVQQRSKEIGIRLAIGATPRAAGRLVMRSGLTMTAIGVAIGLPLAAAVARFMQTLLYQVRPTDAITYAFVSALLAAISVAACYLPARRAMSVDPTTVLRE